MCEFASYASMFILSILYCGDFIYVSLYFRHLNIQKEHQRTSQKVFLGIVLLQCSLRIFFMVSWPFFGTTCDPQLNTKDAKWTWYDYGFGDLPGTLYFSALSVLVWTFARIYHGVLRADRSDRMESAKHTATKTLVILLNLANYITLILSWATAGSDRTDDIRVYVLSGASFVIAVTFLVYGTLCHVHVKSVLRNAHLYREKPMKPAATTQAGSAREEDLRETAVESLDEFAEIPLTPEQPPTKPSVPQRSLSASYNPVGVAIESSANYERPEPLQVGVNPMHKIALIAVICTICFVVRTFLLALMMWKFNDQAWYLLIPYHTIAECFPTLLLVRALGSTTTIIAVEDLSKQRHSRNSYRPPSFLPQPLPTTKPPHPSQVLFHSPEEDRDRDSYSSTPPSRERLEGD